MLGLFYLILLYFFYTYNCEGSFLGSNECGTLDFQFAQCAIPGFWILFSIGLAGFLIFSIIVLTAGVFWVKKNKAKSIAQEQDLDKVRLLESFDSIQ